MTEQEMMQSAAYAEVLADPGADAPRERLADWLHNRWPERARLIRMSLEDGRVHRRSLTEEMHPDSLPHRTYELRKSMGPAWETPVRTLGWVEDWDLVRGFIGYVSVDAATFLKKAGELFSLFPVRHLHLERCAPVIAAIADCPQLVRLRGLEMRWEMLNDDDIRTLADSPYIRNLRWLNLSSNRFGMAGYEALCATSNLPDLVDIDLSGNKAPDPTQHAVWNSEGYWIDPPPDIGVELERKHGPKPWLHAPTIIATYPPSYSAFDGDDPV